MLTTWALMLARARARAGTLLALVATVAVLVLGVSAVIGAIGSAVRAAVVAAVDAAPEEDRAAILTIPASSDPDAQQDAATALISRLFGPSLMVDPLPATDGGALRWQLTVDPDGLDPWGVPTIAADLERLDLAARAVDGLAPQGASVDGGLAATLTAAAEGVRAVQTVIPVPLALIAIGGILATLQLARLLGDGRAGEATLLRARGIAPRAARRAAVTELVTVTLVGAVLGWMLAAVLVTLLAGWSAAVFLAALRATWIIPLVVVLILGPIAGGAAHRAADTAAEPRGGRSRAAVTGLSATLLVLAAGFFVWQLRGLSETGTPDAWGFVVTAVAPALALAAASVLVLTLFAPLARIVARGAARGRGFAGVFPARMVARHLGAFGVVVALVALGAGGAVMAGASISTWELVSAQAAQLRAGGEARAVAGVERVSSGDVAEIAARADAAAVLSYAGAVSDIDTSLVAIPDAAVGAVVSPLPAAGIDPSAMAGQLAHDPVGAALSADADRLTATFGIRGSVESRLVESEDGDFVFTPEGEVLTEEFFALPELDLLEADAWVVDALGTPMRVALALSLDADPNVAGEGVLTADGALPDGAAPWTLVGLRVGYRNSAGSQTPTLTPLAFTTGAGAEVPWPSEEPILLGDGVDVTLMTFAPVPDAVPAVVSTTLADAFGLDVGDVYDLKLARSSRVIPFSVSGFVDAVPGATGDAALMLPLGAVTQSLFASSGSALRGDQVWAAGPDAVSALGAVFGADAVDDGRPNSELTSSLAAAWWTATIIGALLAAVAIVASTTALARRRASDVFVLRALGVTPAAQRRSRFRELAGVAAGSAVAGAVLGGVVAGLTLPALTLAAVPGTPVVLAATVAWGWLPPIAVAIVLVSAVALATIVAGRLVAHQSRAGRVREAS